MHDGNIAAALNRINPITLNELDSVKLMNRVESKYIFPSRKLSDLICILTSKYQVLEIENTKLLPYSTTYLDTPDYLFYYQHVRGEFDRYKIRFRRYGVTDTTFLEIKKKTNKGRTIKWRIENKLSDNSLSEEAEMFIQEHIPMHPILINPVLLIRFTRISMADLKMNERITLDFNIAFSDTAQFKEITLPYLAIAELKSETFSSGSHFRNIMKTLGIYPTGFSKYCVCNAITNENLKKNIIKPKLLLLNRIENEYT